MKISLLALLTSLSAFAAPRPEPLASGSYGYAGVIRVAAHLEFHRVYSLTEKGARELAGRRKAGEECVAKSRGIFLCKAFGALGPLPAPIADRAARILSGRRLELDLPRGEPSLVTDNNFLTIYEVPQAARWDGKSFETYRLEKAVGAWSARLGDPTEAQFALEGMDPSLSFDLTVTASPTAFDVYGLLADFRRM